MNEYLPHDTDVISYEEGRKEINSCLCGNYNHVACIIKGKFGRLKNTSILCYGCNMVTTGCNQGVGIHAEQDAINRLKPLAKRKHLQNIDIFVIRLSKKNKMQNSKPCENCIKNMRLLPERKGYRIKAIYYSNNQGEIVKGSLAKLENDELHYSRFFRKKKKYFNKFI